MEKRRNYIIVPLALLFFAILGLNIWIFTGTARTNNDKTVIEHTQLEFFVPGKRILMQADIADPMGIAEARLYFGTSNDTKNLVFSEMNPSAQKTADFQQEGDSYVGIIPAPSSKTEKIYYCFLAVNYNGDVVKTGLFELHSSDDVGFVPTWQGDLDEYGKTLILGKESISGAANIPSTSLEGFEDSIIVNAVTPDERYYAANKVQRVPGLSTTDGGDVEPSEEAGEVKGKWSRKKKAAVIGGAILGAGAIGGGIAAASGGGGGGGGGGTVTSTTTTTTTTTEEPPPTTTITTTTTTTTTTIPIIQINPSEGVPGGTITFSPNVGQVGNEVDVCICFDTLIGLGNGWDVRVKVDGEKKDFNLCTTTGGCGSCALHCKFENIFKFSSEPHTIVFRLNVEGNPTRLFRGSLPLEFND